MTRPATATSFAAMSAAPVSAPRLQLTLALVGTAAVAGLAVSVWLLDRRLEEQQQHFAAQQATLKTVLGEVTRFRIEQSTSSKGPLGLLEKLRTYAPMAASARTTDPDYRNARKELDAVLVAFESLGPDGVKPIQDRLVQVRPDRDYEEVRWLLEASVRVDRTSGIELLKQVLLGRKLPDPKLRWDAAKLLTDLDQKLAQTLLRQVLRTESSRGPNLDRADAIGATIPDRAAFATTGFHNFVNHYVRTQDPETDDTLLMVMGRTEHDAVTIQECIKVLGERRCLRAVDAIKRQYENPPLQQDNPIFLNYCLEALVEIQGADARPYLQAALPTATSDTVAKRIEFLLNKIATGQVAQQPARATTAPDGAAGSDKK